MKNIIAPDFNMYSKRKDNFLSKEQELAAVLRKELIAQRIQKMQTMKQDDKKESDVINEKRNDAITDIENT